MIRFGAVGIGVSPAVQLTTVFRVYWLDLFGCGFTLSGPWVASLAHRTFGQAVEASTFRSAQIRRAGVVVFTIGVLVAR